MRAPLSYLRVSTNFARICYKKIISITPFVNNMSLPNKFNTLDSGSYAPKITIFFGKTNEFCPENFGIFAEKR